jgi:hypothetical protein
MCVYGRASEMAFRVYSCGQRIGVYPSIRGSNCFTVKLLTLLVFSVLLPLAVSRGTADLLYTYTLSEAGSTGAYDEAMAAASLEGIINRERPIVYLLSSTNNRPQFWLQTLSTQGRWLEHRKVKALKNLDSLRALAGHRLKGVVVWDPDVPATINVATTIAGVRDCVVLSPELAAHFTGRWHLAVVEDLRGKFTGAETGSKKNDSYRWLLREYLAKGLCSPHFLCLFEDAWSTRGQGDIGYVVTRDWAVKNRSFVFDLSPWGDETPADDPGQKTGTDLETYKMLLAETKHQAAGKLMTEMTGFFAAQKYAEEGAHRSAHKGVPTEWESVWLISAYDCYQNTISSDCFNQSFHSHAPSRLLKQKASATVPELENKAYVCFLMADYDSATPLYDFLPNNWSDSARGILPLAWGLNPNLIETYPDLFDYFYSTATSNDTFTADASAAGYMNPNQVPKDQLPLFARHNLHFFREADMTMAPMVLDQDQPSAEVKDAFAQFAPGGFATIVDDMHGQGGRFPSPQVWKGMPILPLHNDTCNSKNSDEIANIVAGVISASGSKLPAFHIFRVVWTKPGVVANAVKILLAKHPELKIEVVSPTACFGLFKRASGG